MCVVRVVGGPLYSALRSVPAKVIHGNAEKCLQEDQNRLLAKMHWIGAYPGSAGPTLAPLATAFLRVTAWWAHMLVRRCRGPVGRFGVMWASFCMCYAGRDLLRLCLCILRVFFLFRTCAPEDINLQKQL